jgi:hypothetical protein
MLLKEIFKEMEAFDYNCEAFIKITRIFEDIFREMETLIRKLRLLKITMIFDDISSEIEALLK